MKLVSEALLSRYSPSAVLSEPSKGAGPGDASWWSRPTAFGPPDYLVDSTSNPSAPHQFKELGEAVDAVLRDKQTTGSNHRRIIELRPGFYEGPVYIPSSASPLTIQGPGQDKAVLAARIDAQMPGREYEARFRAKFENAFKDVKEVFASISARDQISTGNSSVLRIESDDTVLSNLTIRNDYACDRSSAAPAGEIPDVSGRYARGQHQAVALHVAGGDRISLKGLTLQSFQDTLYLQASEAKRASRTHLQGCLIEGDVDFIFGGAIAYFAQCEIRSRGARAAQSWALAPSTALYQPYGFVFDQCQFTHDGAEFGRAGRSFLGRQWFEGARATPYGTPTVAGYDCKASDVSQYDPPHGQISRRTLEAVGKCILLHSAIGSHMDPTVLWDSWSSGPWTPKYRPAQYSASDFKAHLGTWLGENGLDYRALDPAEIWLGIWP